MVRIALALAVALTVAAWLLTGATARSVARCAARPPAVEPHDAVGRAGAPPIRSPRPLLRRLRGALRPRGDRFVILSRATGERIEGATVAMGQMRGASDRNGVVTLPWGASTSSYEVSAAGHMRELGDTRGERWTVWVELTPATEVAGAVLDARSRQPLRGAWVSARAFDGGAQLADATRTDDAGRFSMAVPLGEPFVLMASATGYADAYKRCMIDGPVPHEEILLGGGGVIDGALAGSDPAGDPVYVALVPTARPWGDDWQRSQDGFFRAGTFRFDHVPLGVEYEPVANCGILEACGAPVRFQEHGQCARRDLVLPRPARLTLVARGPEGVPVDDATLTLWRGGTRWPWIGFVRRDGSSFLGGLRGDFLNPKAGALGEPIAVMPGLWLLTARVQGWPEQKQELVLAEGEECATEFTFSDGERIERPAVDDASRPSARVAFRLAGVADGTRLSVTVGSSTDVSRHTAVVAGGMLEQECARLGEPLLLSVRADGFGAPALFQVAPLAPGEVRDIGVAEMGHGCVRRGRVVGPDGRGIAAAKVKVAEAWSYASVRTDRDGGFALVRMPEKPIWLRVQAEGFGPQLCRLHGDTGVIRLAAPGSVEMRCPASIAPVLEGPEVERARAWIACRDGEEGVFRARLQPGPYRAKFDWRDQDQDVHFVVHEGQTTLLGPR